MNKLFFVVFLLFVVCFCVPSQAQKEISNLCYLSRFSSIADPEYVDMVVSESEVYMMRAANHYKRTINMPILSFAVPMMYTDAGETYETSDVIVFNSVYLNKYPVRFLREVVPHEIAHYIVSKLYPAEKQPHGPHWYEVMRVLGVKDKDIKTTHTMDFCK